MTEEKLKQELLLLDKKYQEDIIELKKKYADANNPYKVGDIIQDHIGNGIIEKISYYFSYDTGCKYYCQELKKDGTPKKGNIRRWIYQSNINK